MPFQNVSCSLSYVSFYEFYKQNQIHFTDKTRLEQSIFRYFYNKSVANVINLCLDLVFVRQREVDGEILIDLVFCNRFSLFYCNQLEFSTDFTLFVLEALFVSFYLI